MRYLKKWILYFLIAFAGEGQAKELPPSISSLDRDATAWVFIFVAPDCPISNRYVPRINRLYQDFGSNGIAFRLVYADSGATLAKVEKHRKEYGLRPPQLVDARMELARWAGVEVTPEVAVFSPPEVRWVYRGRIDDQFLDFGKWRQAPAAPDLQRILERILSGETVTFEETRAIGCYLDFPE